MASERQCGCASGTAGRCALNEGHAGAHEFAGFLWFGEQRASERRLAKESEPANCHRDGVRIDRLTRERDEARAKLARIAELHAKWASAETSDERHTAGRMMLAIGEVLR